MQIQVLQTQFSLIKYRTTDLLESRLHNLLSRSTGAAKFSSYIAGKGAAHPKLDNSSVTRILTRNFSLESFKVTEARCVVSRSF